MMKKPVKIQENRIECKGPIKVVPREDYYCDVSIDWDDLSRQMYNELQIFMDENNHHCESYEAILDFIDWVCEHLEKKQRR